MGEEEQGLVTDPGFGTQLPSPGCHGTDCSSLGCEAAQMLLKEALELTPLLTSLNYQPLPLEGASHGYHLPGKSNNEYSSLRDLSGDIPILQTACKSEKVRI